MGRCSLRHRRLWLEGTKVERFPEPANINKDAKYRPTRTSNPSGPTTTRAPSTTAPPPPGCAFTRQWVAVKPNPTKPQSAMSGSAWRIVGQYGERGLIWSAYNHRFDAIAIGINGEAGKVG